MVNAESNSTEFQAESTFRAYTHGQGLSYAQNRLGYEPEFLQFIIDHHTSTGGQLDTIVDVGCGPGTAVRALAPYFAHAIGLDQSEGMISTARSLGGSTSSPSSPSSSSSSSSLSSSSSSSSSSAVPEPINFQVSTAEDLGSQLSPPLIADNSVDLLTAAAAAHWFDMSRFWPRAAQVLNPGGSSARAHPRQRQRAQQRCHPDSHRCVRGRASDAVHGAGEPERQQTLRRPGVTLEPVDDACGARYGVRRGQRPPQGVGWQRWRLRCRWQVLGEACDGRYGYAGEDDGDCEPIDIAKMSMM
ncbi:hypothetical protein I7I51_00623 [Histoplasma capsulatum]|uniref:Methyltransferase type 11 domain-containing protein n=1 Tax=Ajellomyces capsulatus TaxID=5037 RepID=A0A8A1MCI9_AJECA|nr:hypothetical protein I7I51_00623 [Histoplasma capsulatum]